MQYKFKVWPVKPFILQFAMKTSRDSTFLDAAAPPRKKRVTVASLVTCGVALECSPPETEAQKFDLELSSDEEDDQIVTWKDDDGDETVPPPNQEQLDEFSLPKVVPLALTIPSNELEELLTSPSEFVESNIPSSLSGEIPASLIPFVYISRTCGRVEIDYIAYEKSKKKDLSKLLVRPEDSDHGLAPNNVYLEALYKSRCPDLDPSEDSICRDLLQYKKIKGREAERFVTGSCDLCVTPFLYSEMSEFYVLRPAVVLDRFPITFAQSNILENHHDSHLKRARPSLLDACCACCVDCFESYFFVCTEADTTHFVKDMGLCHTRFE